MVGLLRIVGPLPHGGRQRPQMSVIRYHSPLEGESKAEGFWWGASDSEAPHLPNS